MNSKELLPHVDQWLRLAQAQLMSEPVNSPEREHWRNHINFIQKFKRQLVLGEPVINHQVNIDPGTDDKTVIGFVSEGAIKQIATPAQIAEAISFHVGISRSAAIQIVYLLQNYSPLKQIVHTALQHYGKTLAVGGTREKDADWYANSVIDKVSPLIEKQLGLM